MPKKSTNQPCMNPLFLSWLEGWRDEAKEKGLNAQWTYEKAICSLKKYPLPLRSGKEAKILENIGDGIAKKLDKALEEFISNGGDKTMMHAVPQTYTNGSKCTEKPRSYSSNNPRKRNTSSQNETSSHLESEEHDSEAKKKKKEYIPKQRSGPFALLLTLYRESQAENYKGYLNKDELQMKAEPLIEKSFSKAEAGSHYTPWSSMSTLISKCFVTKTSNPAKYSITPEGVRLGQLLDEIERKNPSYKPPEIKPIYMDSTRDQQPTPFAPPLQSHTILSSPPCQQSAGSLPSQLNLAGSLPVEHRHVVTSKPRVSSSGGIASNENLSYWYVGETGKLSNIKDDAVVQIDDNNVWFLIKCEEECLQRCSASYKIDSSRPKQGEFIFAFLSDKDAKNICTPPRTTSATLANSSNFHAPKRHQPRGHDCQGLSELSVGFQSEFRPQNDVISQSSSSWRISETKSATNNDVEGQSRGQLFTLNPGSFEVLLCVDQMEVVGGANTNSKRMMQQQLKRMNVKMDVRKLQLGDFLWIAQEKHPLGNKPREVVLDTIIERKRMDDLAGSIVDGRFKEQKFRLKSCGLKHQIYLIEKYGSMQHMILPESTLKQAIINSQVVDGLFIRQTGSIHESAEYLARLTKHLKNIYQDKTLLAFPVDHVKKMKEKKTFSEVIRHQNQYLMTFDEFCETTNKSRMLSVREMFAKHLMQLKGISADKASAIVCKYETPKRLITAFESCATQNEKENLLSDITFGNAKRKLGPMLAKQICLLYSSKLPLT